MTMTIISSMKRIEVFGPNKSKVILNKDKDKIQSVKQDWNKKGKNRVQITVGQQSIPTECLEWAMIKAMIDAKIITVGTTSTEAAEKKAAKAAKVKETKAAKKLADEVDKPAKEAGHIPPAK